MQASKNKYQISTRTKVIFWDLGFENWNLKR